MIFRSRDSHRYTKILTYKTIIPKLCAGSKTWTLTQRAKGRLKIFERRVHKQILASYTESGVEDDKNAYCQFNEPTVLK